MSSKHTRQKRETQGRRAEFIAALYLRLKGYRILEQRFKTKAGEIDIIAARGSVIVFVEVKARPDIRRAHESVTPATRLRIERAAQIYAARARLGTDKALRFDGIFVTRGWRVSHSPDLWRPKG